MGDRIMVTVLLNILPVMLFTQSMIILGLIVGIPMAAVTLTVWFSK